MGDFNRNMELLKLKIDEKKFEIKNSKKEEDKKKLTCCRNTCEKNTRDLKKPYISADHIMYSRNTLEDAFCEIIHDEDNPSDHLPIYLELKFKN